MKLRTKIIWILGNISIVGLLVCVLLAGHVTFFAGVLAIIGWLLGFNGMHTQELVNHWEKEKNEQ